MKITIQNIQRSEKFLEIKKRGNLYHKIFLFRILNCDLTQFIKMIQEIIDTQNTVMVKEISFSLTIELITKNTHIFCMINDPRLSYHDVYNEISEQFRINFGLELAEINDDDINTTFWGIMQDQLSNSTLFLKEKYFKLHIVGNINYLSIYLIKDINCIKKIADLSKSLKISQVKFFSHFSFPNVEFPQIFLSVESQAADKILKFYDITSEQFSLESLCIYPPSKLAMIGYLLKFLNQNGKETIIPENQNFKSSLTIEELLKSANFQEIKPSVHICVDKQIVVVELKSLNVRLIKFCLKSYYPTNFIIFLIRDGEKNLFKLLHRWTLLPTLKRCRIVKKNTSLKNWKKILNKSV